MRSTFITFAVTGLDPIKVPAIVGLAGNHYFSCQVVTQMAEACAVLNSATWVRRHVPGAHLAEFKIDEGSGRSSLYMDATGFYYAMLRGKSQLAVKLQEDMVWGALNANWLQVQRSKA
jgi:hypothetical protein